MVFGYGYRSVFHLSQHWEKWYCSNNMAAAPFRISTNTDAYRLTIGIGLRVCWYSETYGMRCIHTRLGLAHQHRIIPNNLLMVDVLNIKQHQKLVNGYDESCTHTINAAGLHVVLLYVDMNGGDAVAMAMQGVRARLCECICVCTIRWYRLFVYACGGSWTWWSLSVRISHRVFVIFEFASNASLNNGQLRVKIIWKCWSIEQIFDPVDWNLILFVVRWPQLLAFGLKGLLWPTKEVGAAQ